MDLPSLLDWLAREHGLAYTLPRRLGGVTHGAYEVRGPRGERTVLKFGWDPRWYERLGRAQALVEPLRAVGYPLPRDLASGVTPDGGWYQLQEYTVGETPGVPLSAAAVALLLDLNARQAGCCPEPAAGYGDWSRYAHDVIFAGASGWTAALRDHSPETRALLADLLAVARPHAAAPLATRDLVHGDFLPDISSSTRAGSWR